MANIIDLKTFTDKRGNLTVIDKIVPFTIKRIFYIYGVDDSKRGGHRHHQTVQLATCIQGSCKIFSTNGQTEMVYELNHPNQALLIEPQDWHTMYDFTPNCILMVLASEEFNETDYIFEPYTKG